MISARKKKKKGTPLLALFQLKAALIGALLLKVIGLVAFKALILGKIALTITALVGLKKLFEQKHTSSYEVVATPYIADEHSLYDRSFDQLAYRGHKVTNKEKNIV